MSDAIESKDFADLVLNPGIEEEIVQGKGRAYGLELFLKKHMQDKNADLENLILSTRLRLLRYSLI